MDNVKQLMPNTTICVECASFKNLDPNSPRKDIWYNHICLANSFPKKINPVNGQLTPYTVNDLGKECFTDKEYRYCRDCNDGKCKQFKYK